MASDLPYLLDDILARIAADTGTGGLVNATSPLIQTYDDNFDNTEDEATRSHPSIVIEIPDSEVDSTFRTRRWTRTVEFHVFVEKLPVGSGDYDAVQRCAAIIRRLEGDWEDQTFGTGPTFGFDRWRPTLTGSGWTPDIFEMVGAAKAHSDRLFHWIVTFRVTTNKAGA